MGRATVSSWIRERLVEDPSPGVRAEAAYRLGLLGDPEAKAALNTTIVKDPDSGYAVGKTGNVTRIIPTRLIPRSRISRGSSS